jgi:hypothetical protein
MLNVKPPMQFYCYHGYNETLGGEGGALSHFLLTKLQYILKGLVGIK